MKEDYKNAFSDLKSNRVSEQLELEKTQFIKQGRKYRHFKGAYYNVIGIAKDTEGNEVVVYIDVVDHSMYIRPKEEWFSNVRDRPDNPFGFTTRFMLVN